jgi:ABC-type dipeptide/oligopeptide/nickel transport system permease subunit
MSRSRKEEIREIPANELQIMLRTLWKSRPATFGFIYVIAIIAIAILAPVISPFDPYNQDLPNRLAPPSFPHILGLDEFGRDVFSRLLHGATISLLVGLEVVLLSLLIGVVVGTVSGYYGGKVDMIFMRLADIFLAFPSLVLAIGIMAVLGPSIFNVVLSLVVVSWPHYARVIRSQTITLKKMDFITAAIAIGASKKRILIRHIIPNTIPPIIILATLGMGSAILAEAGLSFLGLGVNPPTPSWGSMIASGRDYILQAPHIVIAPGLMITITVLAFNLLGDGLRDALDPRLKI